MAIELAEDNDAAQPQQVIDAYRNAAAAAVAAYPELAMYFAEAHALADQVVAS